MNNKREELKNSILSIIESPVRGRLLLAPRTGKTKLIFDINKEKINANKILWVVPNSTNIETIKYEVEKWEVNIPTLDFILYRSLHKKTGYYDLIILDEDQNITSKSLESLFERKLISDSLIGLSGTPTKDIKKLNLFDKLELKPLYEFTIKEAVEDNIISPYKLIVIYTTLSKELNRKIGSTKKFKTSEKKLYEYYSKKIEESNFSVKKVFAIQRLRLLASVSSKKEIINKIIEGKKRNKERGLIFSNEKKQALEYNIPYYFSGESDEIIKDFNNYKIDTLSLVNKGGVGDTYPDVDYLILRQLNNNLNGWSTQKISRALLHNGKETQIILPVVKDTKDEEYLNKLINNLKVNNIEKYEYKREKFYKKSK